MGGQDLYRALAELIPEGPDALLDRVLSFGPAERAKLTLHLVSGKELQGVPLAVKSARNGPRVVTLLRERDDVAFVRLEHVEAITVHGATRLVPQRGAPPSRLELRRKAAATAELLGAGREGVTIPVEIAWSGDTEGERAAVQSLLAALDEAIVAALGEEGSPGLQRVERVTLATVAPGIGAAAGVSWQGGTLQLLAADGDCPAADAIKQTLGA